MKQLEVNQTFEDCGHAPATLLKLQGMYVSNLTTWA